MKNIRNKSMRLFAFIFALFLLFGSNTFSTYAEGEAQPNEYFISRSMNAPATLPSYRIRLTGPFRKNEEIQRPPSMDKWLVAYCINGYYGTSFLTGIGYGYAIPPSIGETVTDWYEKEYTDENLYNMAGDFRNIEGKNTHDKVPRNIGEIIKKIIFLGFPYDAKNIRKDNNIEAADYEQITQAVIYNYTDHDGKGSTEKNQLAKYDPKFRKAYDKIVDFIDNHLAEIELPEEFKTRIFEFKDYSNKHYLDYQNLVTASISQIDVNLKIAKVNENNQPQSNAVLKIVNIDTGKTFEQWETDGSKKAVTLILGQYKLVEITAPKGYTVAKDILFNIDNLGRVTIKQENGSFVDASTEGNEVLITMQNTREPERPETPRKHTIKISKVDLGGKEIAGAEIEIKKESGEKVLNWTSEAGKTREIQLEAGRYIFHEKLAPNGYKKVTDITFEISDQGKVTVITDTDTEVKTKINNENTLVITDKDKPVSPQPPVDPDKPKDPKVPNKPVNPRTSDYGIKNYISLGILGIIGIVILRKKEINE